MGHPRYRDIYDQNADTETQSLATTYSKHQTSMVETSEDLARV